MSQRYFIFPVFCVTLMLLFCSSNAAPAQYDLSFEVPLIVAADRGNIHEITRLLKGGAKVNEQGKFGVTALIRAALRGNSEVVKTLLDAGADVHIKDTGGATALHIASRLGHKNICDMLLKYGANPNAVDTQGFTPLERAIKLERERVVQALISEGADLSQKGQSGLTPSELAFQGNNKKIQQIFNASKPVGAAILPKEDNTTNSTVAKESKDKDKKDANVLGTLNTKEETLAKPETQLVVATVVKPTQVLPEKIVVQHDEPIGPDAEESKSSSELTMHPAEENEASSGESFNILAWFQNIKIPLEDPEYNEALEQEVAYTIAEENQLIGPDLTADNEPTIDPQQDVIITKNLPAPEVLLLPSAPIKEEAVPQPNNSVTTSIQNLNESKDLSHQKNNKLVVQVVELPDNFKAAQAPATTNPVSYHVEVGSFLSNIEAKKFIATKLPHYETLSEVTLADNAYKVSVKGLDKERANLLCSNITLESCKIVSMAKTISDESFQLY